MIREDDLIPHLERSWPALKERLDEKVELLDDPEERSAYRGLFNAADLSIDYLDQGTTTELEVLAAAIEDLYKDGDEEVLKALNTAYMEDLWYAARRRGVSLEPLIEQFGPLSRKWWNTTSDWLGSSPENRKR